MNNRIFKSSISTILIAVMIIATFFGCNRDAELTESTEPATTIEATTTTTTEAPEVTTTSTTATTTATTTTTTTTTAPAISVSIGTTGNANETAPALTTKKTTTKKNSDTHTSTTKTEENTLPANACTVTVECTVLLSNMDQLKAGHSKYVPKNGYIIEKYPYLIKGNATVYDALKEACKTNSVKLTAKSTGYGTYIVGINNIDEKDCGATSGWKYKVNGTFPSVSADRYTISEGDDIVFTYALQP
ncbi:MAG: DUF4430 domain-containing protein [Eubacterium sp.]